MATVQASLRLVDEMSRPLQSIKQRLESTTAALKKLQHAMGKTAGAYANLDKVKQKALAVDSNLQHSIENTTRAQRRFNNAMEEGKKKASELQRTMKKGISMPEASGGGKDGGGAGGGLKSKLFGKMAGLATLDNAKQLAQMTVGSAAKQRYSKDMLSAKLGSKQQGSAIFDQLRQESMTTGTDVNESLQGAIGNLSVTKDPGQLLKMNRMAEQMSALDPSGGGMDGAFTAMRSAMQGDTGALSSQYQIPEAAIQQAKLGDLAKEGNIDGFLQAFDQLLEKENMGKKAFEQMLDSPLKKTEVLQNQVKQMFTDAGSGALNALSPVVDELNKAFQAGSFDVFFATLAGSLSIVANGFGFVVEAALGLWKVIEQFWPVVTSMLAALATDYIVGLIVELWAMLPPLIAQAAAWLVINWPILLIGAAIGLVILILLQMGVTFGQIVGFVFGLFAALYAFIYNGIAFVWNIFASFAEFFVNLFIDPVYAIKKLFYDLAIAFLGHLLTMVQGVEGFAGNFQSLIADAVNGAIKGIRKLSHLLNKIPGINIPDMPLFEPEAIHAASGAIKGLMNQLKAPTTDKKVLNIPRMKEKNVKDSFDSGYKTGKNMIDKATSAAKGATGSAKGLGLGGGKDKDKASKAAADMGGNPPGAAKSSDIDKVNKVGSIGSIDDTVDVSNEDMEMMRDLAEMKTIQNFVTLTPTVQVTTGNIMQNIDVNEMISRIETAMSQEIAAAAKGSYNYGR